MELRLNTEMEEYLPLREVVFHTLRKAILTGQMQPGEKLPEVSIAQMLGVSRTPVREAIHKLELEGLVVMVPHKGAEVSNITQKQVRDVMEVRVSLEVLAVQLACQRISDGQLEQLSQIHHHMSGMDIQGELVEIVNEDIQFHDMIYMASDNERLQQMLSQLRQHMYRYRLEYLKDSSNRMRIVKEHEAILEALDKRDEECAIQAIKQHIVNQEEGIMALIGCKL